MYQPAGVYAAMPTPFHRNGDLDVGLLRQLVADYEGTGLKGLLVMGTAGEFAMMSDKERRTVVDVVMDRVDKLETVFNAGCASTKETIDLARYARNAGSNAIIAVEPYFYHPTLDGMAIHYLAIAEAIDHPVMAYNIPSFAGNRIHPDILDQFARDDRVVGLKDSEGDAAKLAEFISRARDGFSVMVGMDSLACTGISLGANGMMIGSAAIAPEKCSDMYMAIKRQDYKTAFDLQRSLDHIIRAMQTGTFPAAIKFSMSMLGHPAGFVRAPLSELSGAERRLVENHLKNAGIIEELFL